MVAIGAMGAMGAIGDSRFVMQDVGWANFGVVSMSRTKDAQVV